MSDQGYYDFLSSNRSTVCPGKRSNLITRAKVKPVPRHIFIPAAMAFARMTPTTTIMAAAVSQGESTIIMYVCVERTTVDRGVANSGRLLGSCYLISNLITTHVICRVYNVQHTSAARLFRLKKKAFWIDRKHVRKCIRFEKPFSRNLFDIELKMILTFCK